VRLRLTLEYDGSAFSGWQIQPEGSTVQGVLEAAFAAVTGTAVRVMGAGRTDAGVHARGQVAHCDCATALAPQAVRRALNAVLPAGVAVLDVRAAQDDFDARRDALCKRYRYRILNRRPRSPLRAQQTWHVAVPLDVAAMRVAAARLEGHHDFAAFRGARGGAPDHQRTERTLDRLRVRRADDEVHVVAESRGFLRYMVRNLTGALVAVGQGRLSPDEVAAILASGDRARAPATAPASGLCLESIWYPDGGEPAADPRAGA
jgi:tRNA pseudouridine38-40 synthase